MKWLKGVVVEGESFLPPVVLFMWVLPLVTITDCKGISHFTSDLRRKNKILALIIGSTPVVTGTLWLIKYKALNMSGDFFCILISVTAVAIYSMIIIKTLISLLKESRKSKVN